MTVTTEKSAWSKYIRFSVVIPCAFHRVGYEKMKIYPRYSYVTVIRSYDYNHSFITLTNDGRIGHFDFSDLPGLQIFVIFAPANRPNHKDNSI